MSHVEDFHFMKLLYVCILNYDAFVFSVGSSSW